MFVRNCGEYYGVEIWYRIAAEYVAMNVFFRNVFAESYIVNGSGQDSVIGSNIIRQIVVPIEY